MLSVALCLHYSISGAAFAVALCAFARMHTARAGTRAVAVCAFV